MILQKILTGSSLIATSPDDADYIVFYNPKKYTLEQVYALKPVGEDWFLVTPEEAPLHNRFFIVLTYLIYQKLNIKYEIGEHDYFKDLYKKYLPIFKSSFDNYIIRLVDAHESKKAWWFDLAFQFIKNNDFEIDANLYDEIKINGASQSLKIKINGYVKDTRREIKQNKKGDIFN